MKAARRWFLPCFQPTHSALGRDCYFFLVFVVVDKEVAKIAQGF